MIINLDTIIPRLDGDEPHYSKEFIDVFQKVAGNSKLDRPLKEFIDEINEEKGVPLTVGLAMRRALLSHLDKDITPEQAQDRFEEAMTMKQGGEYDLGDTMETVVKNNMLKVWGPEVCGFLMTVIKPKADKQVLEDKKEKKSINE